MPSRNHKLRFSNIDSTKVGVEKRQALALTAYRDALAQVAGDWGIHRPGDAALVRRRSQRRGASHFRMPQHSITEAELPY